MWKFYGIFLTPDRDQYVNFIQNPCGNQRENHSMEISEGILYFHLENLWNIFNMESQIEYRQENYMNSI